MPFTLGQRWISDTESELGLGTVVALDARMVTLLFPAIGENRLYSRNDSPITRVMFNPGDTITSHEGWQLHVDKVNEENGLLSYTGTRLDTQEANVTLREVLLDSKLVFSKPQDRLFAGQIDRMDRFSLRYRARKFQSEQYRMPWSGLRGQRTSLIPHQLHIAHDVGRRHAPRVLLADEVGLGKTIEAGMILHQQLLSGAAERVLIVVPETLQHQWLVEMRRRFNLNAALFDLERCAALKESLHEQIIALPEDGTWPFIKSVTLSEDGRSAEILSTKDLYKPERDNAAAQAVYIPALLYAAFTGEDAESFTVHFTVKDETTGDVLGEFDYPVAEPTASESDASGTESTAPSPDTAE